jgi:hypothetical protein
VVTQHDLFLSQLLTARDIYNARPQIRREEQMGYTPTGALIRIFDEEDFSFVVKYEGWLDI